MKNTNYKNVILINDTSNNFHHGCDLVMINLEILLKKYHFKIIKRINNNIPWSKDSNLTKDFENCDIVVINGETNNIIVASARESLDKDVKKQ